jgi:transposase
MIGPGTGVRVYVASGVTDMRKGITGLAAAAGQVLRQNPCSGSVFCFRGRKGDRIKLLYWDQQGAPCRCGRLNMD